MERIQGDGNETDGAPIGDCHENVTLVMGTARSDSSFLVCLPVWMETEKDVVTQDIPH